MEDNSQIDPVAVLEGRLGFVRQPDGTFYTSLGENNGETIYPPQNLDILGEWDIVYSDEYGDTEDHTFPNFAELCKSYGILP